jgi:hypothetical protein
VKLSRDGGVQAEVSHLALEPGLVDVLPPDVAISFVGQVMQDHRQCFALLEAVAARHDIKLWTASQARCRPPRRCTLLPGLGAGMDMYQILRRSKMALNPHIDMAGRESGNMRLFETIGVGAFLLTDCKENLHNLSSRIATSRSGTQPTIAWPPSIGTLGMRMPGRRSPMPVRRGRSRSTPTATPTQEILGMISNLPRRARPL